MGDNFGDFFDPYPLITKDRVEKNRHNGTHRICFATTHADQPKRSSSPYVGSFKVPFLNTIGPMFLNDTGLKLVPDKFDAHWISIREETHFSLIQRWVKNQGTRVFLRDCLDMSVALDFNFKCNKIDHTELGALEARCKNNRDNSAINAIADKMCTSLSGMFGYNTAKFIAAVPSRPGKVYDLPTCLAKENAKRQNLIDLTGHFSFSGQKDTIKETKIDEKWDNWERAGLSFSDKLIERPPVILIDDKYQSGVTIQYVASKLRAAGAGKIYGLCVVKTLRDTDNS